MTSDEVFRTWVVEHGARVECSRGLLDRITTEAREGSRRFRHGGMEIGGLLMGVTRGSTLRIEDIRPIAISYGRGASFLLTDEEDETVRSLIEQLNTNAGPRGMKVVGYYESRTRREIPTSASELEVFDRHFSHPSTVCIIVKPEKESASEVVFVRDQHGMPELAFPAGDVVIESAPPRMVPIPHVAETVEDQPRPVPMPVAPPPIAPAPAAPPPVTPPPPIAVQPQRRVYEPVSAPTFQATKRARKRSWLLFALPVAAAAALAAVLLIPRTPPPAPIAPAATQVPTPPPQPPPTAAEAKPEPVANVASKKKSTRKARSRRARSRKPTAAPAEAPAPAQAPTPAP